MTGGCVRIFGRSEDKDLNAASSRRESIELSLTQTLAATERFSVYDWTFQRGRDPLTISDMEGIYRTDRDGRRYADLCSAQISVST